MINTETIFLLLQTISFSDEEDSKECVSDTYYAVWNKIPPEKPRVLSAFLARIIRNISLNKWRNKRAQKRGFGETEIAFEEIEECVPARNDFVSQIEARELGAMITDFLRKLPEKERRIFVCRYWYLDSVSDISERFGYKESKVKTVLFRTRKKLLSYLEKEGVLDE